MIEDNYLFWSGVLGNKCYTLVVMDLIVLGFTSYRE
jgi:hypothetical protein